MEGLEKQSSAQNTTEAAELRREVEQLKQLFTSVIILGIVISGTLNIYFLRQSRTARADLAIVKPQISQVVSEYNKVHAPVINDFVQKLVAFSEKNPDFMPIVQKYGLVTNSAPPKSAQAPTPAAPSSAQPPKK